MWLVHRDTKRQINRSKIGKAQKSIVIFKTNSFKIHGQRKLSIKKSRQVRLQLQKLNASDIQKTIK